MGTNFVYLASDYHCLIFHKRHEILPLPDNSEVGVIKAFNFTSRYKDDFLNIDKLSL